jgi:hypothetical protein
MALRCKLQKDLIGIYDADELYGKSRSNAKCLLEKDNNTKLFHRVANGNKRKKNIISRFQNGAS